MDKQAGKCRPFAWPSVDFGATDGPLMAVKLVLAAYKRPYKKTLQTRFVGVNGAPNRAKRRMAPY
jgi:hypothetical protein